jgi:hypothetical protein
MMGSQGGSASAVDELKSMLLLVSDPKKLQVSLDELKLAKEQLNASIVKNGVISAEATEKIKLADARCADADLKEKEIAKKMAEVVAKEAEAAQKLANAQIVESAAKEEKQASDIKIAKALQVISEKEKAAQQALLVAKANEEKMVGLREELESKLGKLKAIVGA